MDENKDGHVTKQELQTLFKKLNYDFSPEDIDKMIKRADTNGDGDIEFEEFINAVTSNGKITTNNSKNQGK